MYPEVPGWEFWSSGLADSWQVVMSSPKLPSLPQNLDSDLCKPFCNLVEREPFCTSPDRGEISSHQPWGETCACVQGPWSLPLPLCTFPLHSSVWPRGRRMSRKLRENRHGKCSQEEDDNYTQKTRYTELSAEKWKPLVFKAFLLNVTGLYCL